MRLEGDHIRKVVIEEHNHQVLARFGEAKAFDLIPHVLVRSESHFAKSTYGDLSSTIGSHTRKRGYILFALKSHNCIDAGSANARRGKLPCKQKISRTMRSGIRDSSESV